MEDFLKDLIDSATRPIRTLVDSIVKRLTSIWSVVTGFFGRVRAGLISLRARAQGWVLAQVRHALAVLTTLRWIIVTFIPRKLGDLARSIVAWTLAGIDTVATLARSLVDTLRRWAGAAIDAVRATLRDLAAWATRQLGELAAAVTRLLGHVFGPLANPQRLVAWIIGPLIPALIGWALDNAARLGRVFWAQRARLTLATLDLLEDLIARII